MFPLGHVGLTVALGEVLRRGRGLPLPFPALAVGAVLPDLVDKPVGHLLLDLGSGRLWAHTVVFVVGLLALAAAAGRIAPRAAPALAALAFGSATHLLFDAMWEIPVVLLWPFLGAMPGGTFEPAFWIETLLTSGWVQATEAAGAGALLWAGRREALRRRTRSVPVEEPAVRAEPPRAR